MNFKVMALEPFTLVGGVPYAILLRGDRDVAVRVDSIYGIPV